MEIKCTVNFDAMSRHSFCTFFRDEFGSVVQRIVCSDTIFHTSSTSCSMVWSVCPTYICRSLLWFPEACNGTSSENEPNTKTNSWPKFLHTTNTRNSNGGNSSLWMHLHTTLLRSQLHLVVSDLLYVWILIPRVSYSDHNMFWNDHFALLFPPMRWGKKKFII